MHAPFRADRNHPQRANVQLIEARLEIDYTQEVDLRLGLTYTICTAGKAGYA